MSTFSRVADRATTPIVYVLLLVVWEVGVRAFAVPTWILPAPTEIWEAAVLWAPELFFNSIVTLRETVVGFALALVLSVPLAMILAFSARARRVIYPIVLALQSVPKVAIAPLVTLWFGINEWPKIVIVVLVCFFPILVNVVAGLESAPRGMLDLMRSLRASEVMIFRRLRMPYALPHLFTGCKVAITFAIIGAVIGEFVAAQEGLGYLILMSTSQSQTPLAFAAIIVLTLMGVVLFGAIEAAQRRVVGWTT
ncbi:ABC transporter permease [Amorphus sp. MBR-141]